MHRSVRIPTFIRYTSMLPVLLIALSTPLSEDLTCIATGVLNSQQRLNAFTGIAACTEIFALPTTFQHVVPGETRSYLLISR